MIHNTIIIAVPMQVRSTQGGFGCTQVWTLFCINHYGSRFFMQQGVIAFYL